MKVEALKDVIFDSISIYKEDEVVDIEAGAGL